MRRRRRRLLLILALGGGLAAAPLNAQEAEVHREGDLVYFNFEDVDLATAFESVSEVLGINYVVSGDVDGTITMRTRRGIAIEDVPDVLATVLRSQGLDLVRSDNLYTIVRRAEGGERAGGAVPEGPRDIFVFSLRNASAVDMANLLVALFGGETARFTPPATLAGRSLSDELEDLRFRPLDGLVVERPLEAAPIPQVAPTAGSFEGELVGQTTIVPDVRTNSLVIRTAPENYPSLRETIERLDIRPLQVLIEVVIAEVSLDDRTQFGIDFARFFEEDGAEIEIRNENLPDEPGGFTVSVFDPGDVEAVLRALAADGRLEILSTPRIVASNNRVARILIGSEVPFVQVSSFGGLSNTVLQSVQFRDVGLELTVIPRINEEREVTLQILQENSSVSTESFGDIDAPLITTREAETTLVVGDRRTVVLGGLIETQLDYEESGIPILKDIPVLGYLFKSVDRRTTKRELILTLTPYIIGSDDEAELLRNRIEREWDAFDEDPDALDVEIELEPDDDF